MPKKIKDKGLLRKTSRYKMGVWEYFYAAGVFGFLWAFISMVVQNKTGYALFFVLVAGCCAAFLDREYRIKTGEWDGK